MHVQDKRYPDYIADQIKKGTTTCALTCKDGVVLAADSRASAGFFIADRHVMKIQKVDQHLAMTIVGGVADAQNLVDVMRYNANLYRLQNRELLRSGETPEPVIASTSSLLTRTATGRCQKKKRQR